ncbi:hypothetical protein N7462_008741 [Penicillium macrosclerotiorum]|uniref:uncharacterized protein n=1 Tax=Penicillium macrosclerotiorum TaxID=303699 RepID=UPI0025499FB1|nr:uncharacterized protein N7462_008741 [Penicillium macrosclerotiorum]KAJ5675844.1 hypothetical protein N7462_008741 [Penicillium macrosclerotiorum]
MDAEKIKKKLNGSILKGKKFKIEAARPHKRQRNEDDDTAVANLPGYELPSDRKVKRGWTEPSNTKKDRRRSDKKHSKSDKKEKPQAKSKYTEKAECLFRTTVPPNRSSDVTSDDKKAKKKKKSESESVIHEFAKTMTHPSFLRTSGEDSAPTTEFEEGKGWVDAGGNVKETASSKVRKDNYRPGQVAGAKEKRPAIKNSAREEDTRKSSSEPEDWTSSSGSSSDESSDSESEAISSSDELSEPSGEKETSTLHKPVKETSKPANDPATTFEDPASASSSDSDLTSSSDSDSRAESDEDEAKGKQNAPVQDANEPLPKEVHPLEALFKRSAPEAAEASLTVDTTAGFSFFGNDIESEEESPAAEPQTPFTPFTKKDLQSRGLRSAAPTPDTALASRHRNWVDPDEMDEDEEEEISIDTPVSKPREKDIPKEETEFAKWFWEHRGENNRAWKKRRRDAAKEQRQRDNRKKGMKGKS